MEDNIQFFELPIVSIRLILPNDNTISFQGNSVTEIFFEMNRRFPEGLRWQSVQFSGKNKEDSSRNAQEFFKLIQMYNG